MSGLRFSFSQSCHSEERVIPARNSTIKIANLCRATCGDSSFLGMTNINEYIESKSKSSSTILQCFSIKSCKTIFPEFVPIQRQQFLLFLLNHL